MHGVAEGGLFVTKYTIINYHRWAAVAGMGWGRVSLTKDQIVTALAVTVY